jgi:uncharacterized RDD family membrane protein YckC
MTYCVKCGAQLTEGAQFCSNCGTPATVATTPASAIPETGFKTIIENQQAQGYWIKRIVALIIDYIILAIVIAILSVSIYLPFIFSSNMAWLNFGLFPFIIGLISLLYFPVSETYRGETVGKSIMGLRVTTLKGTNPNFGQAFIRNISKIYWVLLLLDVIIGLAIQTDYKQKFSDKYAGTVVVQK